MALIFPRIPIIYTLSCFEYSPRKWKCSVPAYGNDVIFPIWWNIKKNLQ